MSYIEADPYDDDFDWIPRLPLLSPDPSDAELEAAGFTRYVCDRCGQDFWLGAVFASPGFGEISNAEAVVRAKIGSTCADCRAS
jgi:hypothetical protein